MTIPNATYRKIHEMFYSKKRLDRDAAYCLIHHLLTAAMDSAVDMRNASCVLGSVAEKANNLGQYRLAEKLAANAMAFEIAVKAAGGYAATLPEEEKKS